jgi:hypothetical protein
MDRRVHITNHKGTGVTITGVSPKQALEQAKAAEVRRIGAMTDLNWTTPSGTAEIHNILRSWVALQNTTGLPPYAGGLRWGGEFKDYADFHGRMVALTVNVGTPQVTVRIVTLGDLGVVTGTAAQSSRMCRTAIGLALCFPGCGAISGKQCDSS